MSGRIVLLNGAPSVGKTTLARAIQERCPTPLWHRSLDDFVAGFGAARPGDFERIVAAYLAALRALVDNEVDVVAEAVIVPERRDVYRRTFEGARLLLVGVRCPLDVAQAREAARTDRTHVDLDHPWWFSVHEHEYDLEVDTSDLAQMQLGADRVVERFLEL